jgi:hypothetical protein
MATFPSVVHNTDTVSVVAPAKEDFVMIPSPAADTSAVEMQAAPAGDAALAAGTLGASAGLPGLTATSLQHKRSPPVWRWAAAPILIAAAYVCWVLARQVLWGAQEREPWTLLSVSSLVYLVAVAWTMVLVAVTVWGGHRSGRLFWPWALLVCGPGLVYLYHFAALNKDWGGGLGAEFYEMIALVAALGTLALVAAIGCAARLAPPIARLLRRLRRLRSASLESRAVEPTVAEARREPSADPTG